MDSTGFRGDCLRSREVRSNERQAGRIREIVSRRPRGRKIVVLNGEEDGSNRAASAKIKVNGRTVFGPADFNQTVYRLEVSRDLLYGNDLEVELASAPGSFLTLEIVQGAAPAPPETTLTAEPTAIAAGESSVLTWSSANADSCFIAPGAGAVDLNGSMAVSPSATTTYTITAEGPGGSAADSATVTVFPSGKEIRNVFDATRLSRIETPEGNVDFAYLPGGLVGSAAKGGESILYGYDGSLLLSETFLGTLNACVGYAYDADFNARETTYAGRTEAFAYDRDGLLIGSGVFAIARNAQNGLPEAVNGPGFSLTRSFDAYGEPTGETLAVNGNALYEYRTVRDRTGRIVSKTETAAGVARIYEYTYDDFGRLLAVTIDGETVESYAYNAAGARAAETNLLRGVTGRTYEYSEEDHLLSAGGGTFRYDADGFLVEKTEGAARTSY